MAKQVILVDENDKEVGTEEKIKAHKNGGKRHRAFSIFVYNSNGKILLQKRAEKKYHFGGLWTNTCCSHPKPKSTIEKDVHERLKEEMGFDTDLKEIFKFEYKAPFENGLTEWELDHVFVGIYDENDINPNPKEVGNYKWIGPQELLKDIKENPQKYTPWFKKVVNKVIDYMKNKSKG